MELNYIRADEETENLYSNEGIITAENRELSTCMSTPGTHYSGDTEDMWKNSWELSNAFECGGRRLYKVATGCMGMVCFLLLIFFVVLCIYYNGIKTETRRDENWLKQTISYLTSNYTEKDWLRDSYMACAAEKLQIQMNYSICSAEKRQLQTSYDTCLILKDQLNNSSRACTVQKDHLESSYNSCTVQKDTLQTNYSTCSSKLTEKERAQQDSELCSLGWRKFGTRWYYISTDKKSWHAGRDDCKKKGGDLIIINSLQEQNIVINLDAWIGLSDIHREGTWKWVDETPLTTSYWRDGEPNNSNNEDCAMNVARSNSQKSWNDASCSSELIWVCEKTG